MISIAETLEDSDKDLLNAYKNDPDLKNHDAKIFD